MDYRVRKILSFLRKDERIMLRARTRENIALEDRWKRRFDSYIADLDEKTFVGLVFDNYFDYSKVDFLPIILEHSYNVMWNAIRHAKAEHAIMVKVPATKLAKKNSFGKKIRIPRSFKELKEMYDLWRSGKVIPIRQRKDANDLRKAYIKRCESVWEKYGKDFREGMVYSRKAVSDVLKDRGDMARSRANTIVQTETTHFYNEARIQFYDKSPDVTHYLFVPIRDKATTPFCKSRSLVVYKKGSQFLREEKPPIHYNCRSEMLPLTPLNPAHRRLIEDTSKARENRNPVPLPKGWNRAR